MIKTLTPEETVRLVEDLKKATTEWAMLPLESEVRNRHSERELGKICMELDLDDEDPDTWKILNSLTLPW